MLSLTASEVKVLSIWAEKGASSPFPQEIALYNRVKNNIALREMSLSAKELEVVLHWADQETLGHHGTNRYLLEQEESLLNKIENYLNESDKRSFSI